jgi:TRAP-type C4-dicarboxylate transport system permease large subunit
MSFLEVSKKISLTRDVTQEELKQALLNRIRRALDIGVLKEEDAGFYIEGTTGGVDSFMRHAQANLHVNVTKDRGVARITVHGSSQLAKSLWISYTGLFLIILLAGLLPGSIETSGESSGAADALVFLIFGIFIFFDIQNKLLEPRKLLQAALDSLEVEFG